MSSLENRHAQLFAAFDRLCDAPPDARRTELRRLESEDPGFAFELAALLEDSPEAKRLQRALQTLD